MSSKIEPKHAKYRYSRDEMIKLREVTLSRTRPSYLSIEFNNENGLFSPDLWLQHRWVCEGIASRPEPSRKKPTNLKPETSSALESEATILSPQRRGFSSGCRAPSPKNDAEKPQSKIWRNSKASNGVDFKPAFQKSVLESGRTLKTNVAPNWRTIESAFKPFDKGGGTKNKARGNVERDRLQSEDKLPDWFDEGPTSQTDIIELKGFEEDENDMRYGIKNVHQLISHSNSPSVSSASPEIKPGQILGVNTNNQQPHNLMGFPFPIHTNGLPLESDAEFAKLIGILDSATLESTMMNDAAPVSEPASSRLSRFFSKPEAMQNAPLTQSNSMPFAPRPIVGASIEQPANGPPILQKLFANAPSKSDSNEAPRFDAFRGRTLEEIERGIRSNVEPTEPLHNLSIPQPIGIEQQRLAHMQMTDPAHHAHLWHKLQVFANQHEKAMPVPERSTISPGQIIGGQPMGNPNEPVMPAPFSMDDQLRFHHQLQAASLLRAQMLQLHQTRPELVQNLNQNQPALQALLSNYHMLRAMAANANNSGNQSAMPNLPTGYPQPLPNVTPSTSANTTKNITSASFMPTSVMRQLTKTTSSANSVAGSSTNPTPSNLQPINTADRLTPSRESPSISSVPPVQARGSPPSNSKVPSPESQAKMSQAYCPSGRVPSPRSSAHDNELEKFLIQQRLAQMAALIQQSAGLPIVPGGIPPGVWRGPMVPHGMNPQFHMRGPFPPGPFQMHPSMVNMASQNISIPPHLNNPQVPSRMPEHSTQVLPDQKAPNALEKLLTSPPNVSSMNMAQLPLEMPKVDKPAILNRLPPSAKPISVEDLEREIAAAALGK